MTPSNTHTANSIVHRDLKPDNVLLSGNSHSNVKLADLGLALPAYDARISRAGVIVGTAAYMAPEQALGQTIDGRADLYALGVLLYELTTGRVPFTGDDPLTIVSQHVHAPVVPPRVLRQTYHARWKQSSSACSQKIPRNASDRRQKPSGITQLTKQRRRIFSN